jgi:ribosomal protein L11 methyltransferase
MPPSYVELQIESDQRTTENLVGIMSQLGFEGFWEDGPVLRCYMSIDRWNPLLLGEAQAVANLVTRSGTSPQPRISMRMIEDTNWNEQWERTIQPIRVTDRIVITPSWHTYDAAPGEIVLQINPKMSFGTGYHETTRLMLKLVEQHIRSGMDLLDIGTGTGVLAIAGVKLGARSAIGVDTDEWSYHNALENSHLNMVGDKVNIVRGDLSCVRREGFDMIFCNIQRNIIEQLIDGIARRLSTGGKFLLSGILVEEGASLIRSLTASGFEVIEGLTENEWSAFVTRHHA